MRPGFKIQAPYHLLLGQVTSPVLDFIFLICKMGITANSCFASLIDGITQMRRSAHSLEYR